MWRRLGVGCVGGFLVIFDKCLMIWIAWWCELDSYLNKFIYVISVIQEVVIWDYWREFVGSEGKTVWGPLVVLLASGIELVGSWSTRVNDLSSHTESGLTNLRSKLTWILNVLQIIVFRLANTIKKLLVQNNRKKKHCNKNINKIMATAQQTITSIPNNLETELLTLFFPSLVQTKEVIPSR